MAKNWQYGRLRTVALQVVMWLTFGASLGLAAYIDHRRSGALDVRLGKPITEGRLVVRVPVGWEVIAHPRVFTLFDYDEQGSERRRVTITQEQQVGRARGAAAYLQQLMSARNMEAISAQPFSMMGQDDGVLVAFRVDTIGMSPELPRMGLHACVVLPNNFAVTLQVAGEGTYGPSGRQLMRTLADNVRLADATADGVSATRSRTTCALPIEEP